MVFSAESGQVKPDTNNGMFATETLSICHRSNHVIPIPVVVVFSAESGQVRPAGFQFNGKNSFSERWCQRLMSDVAAAAAPPSTPVQSPDTTRYESSFSGFTGLLLSSSFLCSHFSLDHHSCSFARLSNLQQAPL